MKWLSHPYASRHGATALADDEAHINEMLELVLFTSPGERVNRPEFGCGLAALIFEGNSAELADAVQLTLEAAIHRWLGELIEVRSLTTHARDAKLDIEIRYLIRRTGQSGSAILSKEVS